MPDDLKTQKKPGLTPGEKRILLITCFGHFLSHFNMLVFPSILLPLADRLHMDMADVLGLSFWMYLLFGVTALPWGVAADKWGAGPFLLLFYVGAGLSCIATALLIDSPMGLTVSLAAIGLFTGIYHPAGLGWISKEVERVSIGLAYNGMFGNLGLATAPLLAGIVNWIWGVRGVYFFVASVNLTGAVLMIAFREYKSDEKSASVGDKGGRFMSPFLVLLIAMMLGGIAYRGATVVVTAYFELKNTIIFEWINSMTQAADITLTPNLVATLFTSLIFLIGMLGQYSGGRAAERFDLGRSYLLFHAIPIPIAFIMAGTSDFVLVGLAIVYFFFLLGMQPIENTLVAKLTPRRFHHAAFGAKFVLTFGVGAFAVKMTKIIKVNWGIDALFPSLGLVSIVLVLVILVLNFTIRKTEYNL